MTISFAKGSLAFLSVSLGLAALASSAAAQSNCDWYAKTAVRQQQINEDKKCGFTGDAWH